MKTGRPKGQNPSPEVLEREAEVIKLRRGGLTWDMISQRIGYADPSAAHKAYMRAMNRIVYEDVVAARQTETDRLDMLQAAHWGKALQGDVAASNIVIKVIVERAKLLGLNAPIKIQQEVITYDAGSVQSELARIIASANGNTADSGETVQVAELTGEAEPVTA